MEKKRLLFTVLSAALVCCTNPHIGEQLTTAEQLIEIRPDSALLVLQDIDRSRIHDKTTSALYSLLYSQALDKNYIDVDCDTLIMPAVRYYSRRDDAHRAAMAYYYYGRVLENAGNIEGAIKAFVDAKRYVADDDYYIKGLLYASIGNIHLNQRVFNEAISNYNMAIDAFRSLDSHLNLEYMYAARAKANMFVDRFEDAIADYEKALYIAEQYGEIDSICEYSSELSAALLYQQNDASSALSVIQNCIRDYCYGQATTSMYPLLCAIYYKLGENSLAYQYGRLALDNIDKFTLKQQRGLFLWLSLVEERQGNYYEALQYRVKSEKLGADIDAEDKSISYKEIENRYEYQLSQEQLSNQKIHNKYIRLVYISLIITILIVSAIVYLLIKKRLQAQKLLYYDSIAFTETLKIEIDTLKSDNNHLFEELGLSNELSRNLSQSFDDKIQSMREFLDIASACENNHSLFVKQFKNFIKLNSDNNKFWGNLIDVVNIKHKGILDYLKQRYPNLSYEDLQLCGLICLDFSVSSICILFGNTSPNSIYNRRYRLRTKLHLQPEINIATFLKNLIIQLNDSSLDA